MTFKRPDNILPYGRHCIGDEDIDAVVSVLRSDWLTTGPMVEKFEKRFAGIVGAQHAISCNSGTAALHLAAMALELGPDDQVIVPSLTFVATANVVRFCGAEVIFADVEANTGLMGLAELNAAWEKANQAKVRAVFPVHLAGQCWAPAEIHAWGAERGVHIVEDACHAIGTKYGVGASDYAVGSGAHALMSCFSLHPVKTVAMGEGGVVTTNSEKTATELRRLRGHGLVRDAGSFQNRDMAISPEGLTNPWYYEMPSPSPNYRASDLACALGFSQLSKLDHFIQRRQELVNIYDARLQSLAPYVVPIGRRQMTQPGWHLYPVLIDFDGIGISRATLMQKLLARGIGTQVHYIPVHRQPYYRKRYGSMNLTGADRYYQRTLSLPLFPAMAANDVEFVVDQLKQSISAP